jgi:hypothetical protein
MVRSFKDLNRNGRRAAPRFRSSGLACSCLARVLCRGAAVRMPRERARTFVRAHSADAGDHPLPVRAAA